MNRLISTIIMTISGIFANSAFAMFVPERIDIRFLGCVVTLEYKNSGEDQWHNYNYTESCSNQKNREANVLLQNNNVFIRYIHEPGTAQQYFRIYHGEIVENRNIRGVTINKTTHRNHEGFYRYPTIRNDFNGIIIGSEPVHVIDYQYSGWFGENTLSE